MRARNLKPSLFRNELLAVADPLFTVVFQGLWCLADRAGRLENRPAKIHLEINPGRAFETTKAALAWLSENGFVHCYEVGGAKFIQVVNFAKHQNPHCKEPDSTIPAPDLPGADPVQAGLIPDSGFLTPDPPNPRAARPVELHATLPQAEWDEWLALRKRKRWPCDDTTLRKQLKFLAAYPTEVQRGILDYSMRAPYQGLFEPKGNGKAQPPAKRERPPTPDEIAAARRKAAADNQEAVRKLGFDVLKAMP